MTYKTKRTIKLHVQRKGGRGHMILVFGPKEVSIGSDACCTLQLDSSIPPIAATITLSSERARIRPVEGVTDTLGYDIISGYMSAGDVFVIGVYTITVIEICETATVVANPLQEECSKENFKFKNHTLEDTISHFKNLALSDDDYSMLVQWLEETRDYRKAMHEIRDSLSKVPNIY